MSIGLAGSGLRAQERVRVWLEYRSPQGKSKRLHTLAVELVRLKVDVIVTITSRAAIAAKKATTTIPVVMGGASRPVKRGLVASLARPGGNLQE
ncbi:MAG: ABC transporter substrate binding protein [Deltaproteobacteria bacterium]|nr:ABC transporter substrate binding protein [Deltaproteobacteria bacterium]